ncbi:hypothetical protein [Haladaptatus sp. NG-WS-4]
MGNVILKTRRSILAATGALLLAGCSSINADSTNFGGTETTTTETIVNDRDTVNEDHYLTYTFTLNRKATLDLSVTVREGPRLDIVFTSQDELAEFEAGNHIRYNENLSFLNSLGGDATLEVPKGDYALIVDNTDAIDAQPPTNFTDDNARVEIRLTAR